MGTGEKMLKILKKAWAIWEFYNSTPSYNDNPSEYIDQDSFRVTSENGNYSEFDFVIMVNSDTQRDIAQKFQDHVHKVGDDIKVAVVYI